MEPEKTEAQIKEQIKHEIEFNGSVFTVKSLNLAIYKAFQPVRANLITLQYMHTAGIDMSDVEVYKDRIAILKEGIDSIDKACDDKNEPPDDAKKKEYLTEKIRLNGLLIEAETNFNNDLLVQQKDKFFKDKQTLAYEEWLCDTVLMKPFIEQLLEGDFSKFDWNDFSILSFISEVISNFFYLISSRAKK
jgi:hypothetical protein